MSDIKLVGGSYFNFTSPDMSGVHIRDIAHALSNICRFCGHTRTFYSVAQHSVLASYLVPEGDELAALLHDAAEAFIGDVSSPLKRMLPDYKRIEERIERAVFSHFGVPFPLPESVKRADLVMLCTEKRDLMNATADIWEVCQEYQPLLVRIQPATPSEARDLFLRRFYEVNQ